MRKQEHILSYAQELAGLLTTDMRWATSSSSGSRGWWAATNPQQIHQFAARGTAAVEFFRQYAGGESLWAKRAVSIFESRSEGSFDANSAHALGDLLHAWVDQVNAGIVEIAGLREWEEIGVVSTDVMSQVNRLMRDRNTHPAAPIVLCGAALEIALRALADARSITIPARPTFSTLSAALRQADVLTAQDVKDLEQCAGLRNSAAHGDFEALSRERAGLMEQQTNLLLRRLADLLPVGDGATAPTATPSG